MGETRGVHVILTTHNTWLHGDPRGSWHEGKLIDADSQLLHSRRDRMVSAAVALDAADIAAVATGFAEVIAERRLECFAATIQRTHAHLLFAAIGEPIATIIAALKRRSAKHVNAARRRRGADAPRHLWSAGRFPVFVFDDDHLRNAIAYIRRHNTVVGDPADPWPWVRGSGMADQNGPPK